MQMLQLLMEAVAFQSLEKAGFQSSLLTIAAGEEQKTLNTFSTILDAAKGERVRAPVTHARSRGWDCWRHDWFCGLLLAARNRCRAGADNACWPWWMPPLAERLV